MSSARFTLWFLLFVIFLDLLLSNIEYPAQIWFIYEFYKHVIYVYF